MTNLQLLKRTAYDIFLSTYLVPVVEKYYLAEQIAIFHDILQTGEGTEASVYQSEG